MSQFQRHIIVILFIILSINSVGAQDLPPCGEREFIIDFPRVEPLLWCRELPIVAESEADMTYTSMLFDDTGTLYATHPMRGDVVAMTDSDGDSMPDSSTVIADNLAYPHGIALHDGVLYVIGDGVIYAIDDEDVTVLVDDLPGGRGFLARAITIHDEMLYIAVPMPCDFCEADDPLHGTVIRMRLDGGEREIVARGLRYPTALHFYDGFLWVTDVARDAFSPYTTFDELNRIDLIGDDVPHFGFPYCFGNNQAETEIDSDFDCTTDATAPHILIQSNSTPFALTTYDHDLFPWMTGRLLIAFFGSSDNSRVTGHALLSLEFVEDRIAYELVTPVDNAIATGSSWMTRDGIPLTIPHSELINTRGAGIWPHFLYDVAISPQGWLYFSVGGKGIYVIREHEDMQSRVCDSGVRDCDG